MACELLQLHVVARSECTATSSCICDNQCQLRSISQDQSDYGTCNACEYRCGDSQIDGEELKGNTEMISEGQALPHVHHVTAVITVLQSTETLLDIIMLQCDKLYATLLNDAGH